MQRWSCSSRTGFVSIAPKLAACAIVGPIALGFAGRHKINPLLMGMFVVHGAQAGGWAGAQRALPGSFTSLITSNSTL